MPETKHKRKWEQGGDPKLFQLCGPTRRTSSRANSRWSLEKVGAKPLPSSSGLQDASGCFITFFLEWGRGWLPLNRFSCKRGLGGWRRQDVNSARLSEASKIVHGWTSASIHHGLEESWWGGPAMLSRYLICSLLGHAALRVCLQLQPVLIIRSEYSSPWAYDRKPEQNSIPHFKLGLPFFVCVCSFCLFLV